MKTDLLLLAGTALLFASVPMVSHASDDDWSARSPLAMGEPMDDCGEVRDDSAIALKTVPSLATEKVEAILATPDVVPGSAPLTTPAVVVPEVLPAKAPPDATTQAVPRPLSPAALLTFALIASPGTALPQTGSRD